MELNVIRNADPAVAAAMRMMILFSIQNPPILGCSANTTHQPQKIFPVFV